MCPYVNGTPHPVPSVSWTRNQVDFESKKHWEQDVVYRLHMGLPVYNKLMEPMTLSSCQEDEFRSQLFLDLGPEFPFPEDLLPKHSRVDSKLPFMTLVSCFCDWLRSGGDSSLVQRLWGHFLATLGEREPEFTLKSSRSETAVSLMFPNCSCCGCCATATDFEKI